MEVRYYEEDRSINVELYRDSDGFVFQSIADELSKSFNVQWKVKNDGLDQRYWDFEIKEITLTLHLEHYLGISIFADRTNIDIEQARIVLREIGEHFKEWTPTV